MMTKPARTSLTPPDAFGADDPRWAVVSAGLVQAGDSFVYAVRTTGIYCRPGCASRRPRRENVRFFDEPALARMAGYRPCLRCRPDQDRPDPDADSVALACRLIEAAETPPSLTVLAAAVGLSPFHFQRRFKAAVGLTPAAYARARRSQRIREALAGDGPVTEAIYAAGFNSSGRFYEAAADSLGMTPTAFKKGGHGEVIRFAVRPCWLGQVMVAATERGVCAITLGDDPQALLADLRARFAQAQLVAADADFEHLVAQALAVVEHPARGHALPLDIRGAAFQQRVWDALRRIPAGATASYGQIAAAIGAPGSARAVARACASNALAVAIPCHRVVRADGALAGYRWGVERKQAILTREKPSK
jgi:AraC family transcriptional regulator of adaptative response/methylated-DNA-[protein]-cysteine methyltransferase